MGVLFLQGFQVITINRPQKKSSCRTAFVAHPSPTMPTALGSVECISYWEYWEYCSTGGLNTASIGSTSRTEAPNTASTGSMSSTEPRVQIVPAAQISEVVVFSVFAPASGRSHSTLKYFNVQGVSTVSKAEISRVRKYRHYWTYSRNAASTRGIRSTEILAVHEVRAAFLCGKYLTLIPNTGSICSKSQNREQFQRNPHKTKRNHTKSQRKTLDITRNRNKINITRIGSVGYPQIYTGGSFRL